MSWSWRDATVWSRLTWRWKRGKWINQIEILQPCTVAPRRATKQKEYLIKTERRNRQRNFGFWIIEAFWGWSVCLGLCCMWETSWMEVYMQDCINTWALVLKVCCGVYDVSDRVQFKSLIIQLCLQFFTIFKATLVAHAWQDGVNNSFSLIMTFICR